jgi:hypothetical protein
MRRGRKARGATLGAAALSSIVLPAATAEARPEQTQVRFLHAVSGAGPAALVVQQGQPRLPASFAEPSGYRVYRAGQVRLQLLVGKDTRPSATEVVRLGPGKHTVVAVGGKDGVDLLVYRDDGVESGKATIRAIHAASEVGRADVQVDGKTVVTGVGLGDATGYLPVPPGRHEVAVTRPGGQGGALVEAPVRAVTGTASTAFVVGSQGMPAQVVLTKDGTAGPAVAPATGLGGATSDGSWLLIAGSAVLGGTLGGATYLLARRSRSRRSLKVSAPTAAAAPPSPPPQPEPEPEPAGPSSVAAGPPVGEPEPEAAAAPVAEAAAVTAAAPHPEPAAQAETVASPEAAVAPEPAAEPEAAEPAPAEAVVPPVDLTPEPAQDTVPASVAPTAVGWTVAAGMPATQPAAEVPQGAEAAPSPEPEPEPAATPTVAPPPPVAEPVTSTMPVVPRPALWTPPPLERWPNAPGPKPRYTRPEPVMAAPAPEPVAPAEPATAELPAVPEPVAEAAEPAPAPEPVATEPPPPAPAPEPAGPTIEAPPAPAPDVSANGDSPPPAPAPAAPAVPPAVSTWTTPNTATAPHRQGRVSVLVVSGAALVVTGLVVARRSGGRR